MNQKQLYDSYQQEKGEFHHYIDNVKRSSPWDVYTIINPTLIKNPYASSLPKSFFLNNVRQVNNTVLFIKNLLKFYLKNSYLLVSYLIAFVIYKLYYKKKRTSSLKIVIDIFGLVDKTNKSGEFNENYLTGVYKLFEKHNTGYAILLRPYGVARNPFKLRRFFKIINQDKRDFIFEYELLKTRDLFTLFGLIFLYPFKTLRLLQKENSERDKIFNQSLLSDIKYFSFDGLTRYILGKHLAEINSMEKIFSWSEFQVIERSFNYAIRKNSHKIKLKALQFYLNYEVYFNSYVDDLDDDMLSAPHEVFVNGRYYIQNREKVKYSMGVSLRYKNIFRFKRQKSGEKILLLGSYIESDTKYMLESVKDFDNILFKNHPAVDIKRFGELSKNITVSNDSIYKLFKNTKIVIGTASGTSVEAVACGISVIIVASQDNLTANPLVECGKGKIWDIAFEKEELKDGINALLEFRKNNRHEIHNISTWYKDNFFVEPTEESIIKVFKLDKD
jgi:hypothetical protein